MVLNRRRPAAARARAAGAPRAKAKAKVSPKRGKRNARGKALPPPPPIPGVLIVASEEESIPVPSNRQVLEELPSSGSILQAPGREQMSRMQQRRCECCGGTQCESYGGADSDLEGDDDGLDGTDVRVEADEPALSSRFPRRLRLAGISCAELERDLLRLPSTPSALGASDGLTQEAYVLNHEERDLTPAAAAAIRHGRTRPSRGPSRASSPCGSARASLGVQRSAASGKRLRGVWQRILRKIDALNNLEFCYQGLHARTHLGVPAWVAKYKNAVDTSALFSIDTSCELEIVVLADSHAASSDQAAASSSMATPSSSSSSSAPPPTPAVPKTGIRWGEKPIFYEISARRLDLSRRRRPDKQQSFYFRGDETLIPYQMYRPPTILRGQASALDLLFRSPASTPCFELRSPRLSACRVRIDRSDAGGTGSSTVQSPTGQLYRQLAQGGPRAPSLFPSELRICAIEGECKSITGNFQRCTTVPPTFDVPESGVANPRATDLEELDRGDVTGAPERPRRGVSSSRGTGDGFGGCPVSRMSDLRMGPAGIDGDDGYYSDGSYSSGGSGMYSDDASDGDGDMSGSEISDDGYGWIFYACRETGVVICPLPWREDRGDSDSDDEDCSRHRARWLFVEYLNAGAQWPPSLTDRDLQRSLSQTFAWIDIPGDADLAGEVEVAVPEWTALKGAKLTPIFSREDEIPRQVVVPQGDLSSLVWSSARGPTVTPPMAEASSSTADGDRNIVPSADPWDVRFQLLKSSLGLLLSKSHRSARVKANVVRLVKSLPLGTWVDHDKIVALRCLGFENIFERGGSVPTIRKDQQIIASPGPVHQHHLTQVPSSLQSWIEFGTSTDVHAVAEMVRRWAARSEDEVPDEMQLRMDLWQCQRRALSMEVCRSGNSTLDFRVCARPFLLLVGLLGDAAYGPANDPDDIHFSFRWRLERSNQPLDPIANVSAVETGLDSSDQPRVQQRMVGGPTFTLMSNHSDPEHEQPPRFNRYPLRSDQLRTLHWMRTAESSEHRFSVDHEVVDDNSWFHATWRLRGRLQWSTRVRGGVLGDKVGYGKTATTIGLVSSTLDENPPQLPRGKFGRGRIPSRATLVLCPVNLLAQWLGEINKFVEGGLRVITLQTYAQLKRITVQELAEADLVVASYRLFQSAPYLNRLREFALAVAPIGKRKSKTSGKQRGPQRLIRSRKKRGIMSQEEVPLPLNWPPTGRRNGVPINPRGHCCRKRSLRIFERDYSRVIMRLEEVPGPLLEPFAKRRRLADDCKGFTASYCAAGSRVVAGNTSDREHDGVPLEMFHWKRVVLDEFHELMSGHPPAQVAARYLRSQYLWGLSGTPPCKTVADVGKMAAFFRVFMRGYRNNSQTSQQVCQKWLDRYVRRNTEGLPDLKAQEEIVLVRQHPAERALYLQLAQAASDADLAGEDEFKALVAIRRRGLEGLVKMCSHFQLTGAQLQRSAKDECDAVLQQRRRELAAARTQLKKQYEMAYARIREFRPYCRGIFASLANPDELLGQLTPTDVASAAPRADAPGQVATAEDDPVTATRLYAKECLASVRAAPSNNQGTTVPHAKALQQHLRRAGITTVPSPRSAQATSQAYRTALASFRATRAGGQMRREAMQAQNRAQRTVNEAKRGLKSLEARARLVQFFEATVRAARDEELLRCPICLDDVEIQDRSVLPCAHIGCVNCFEEVAKRDKRCPVCRASVQLSQVMRLEIPEPPGSEDHNGSGVAADRQDCGRYGSKIARLIRLLADIATEEPEARVILFVQWEDLKRKVAGALEEFGVEHAVLQGSVWARQKTIARFQNSCAGDGPRVLLLSLQDSASGTNLTAASHVILFHPMISTNRQASVACEMQAVGRALRAGQTQTVRIWRFVVAGTAEQRITEEHQQDLWERFRAGTRKELRVALTTRRESAPSGAPGVAASSSSARAPASAPPPAP